MTLLLSGKHCGPEVINRQPGWKINRGIFLVFVWAFETQPAYRCSREVGQRVLMFWSFTCFEAQLPLKTTATDMNPSWHQLSSDTNFSDPCANTTHMLMALFFLGVPSCFSCSCVGGSRTSRGVSGEWATLEPDCSCWLLEDGWIFQPFCSHFSSQFAWLLTGYFSGECAAF